MKGTKILSALMLITLQAISQTPWNNEVPTLIPDIGTNTKLGSAVDYRGIHVIYWIPLPYGARTLKYALLNSEGGVIRSNITIDSDNGSYASAVTRNGIVYVTYEKSNEIKIARSTNAGETWVILASRAMNGSPMNGLATQSDDRGIHVAWSEYTAGTGISETYYVRRKVEGSGQDWFEYKNVTDFTSGEEGEVPSLSLSQNKVHIGYNDPAPNLDATTRDLVWATSTWEDPQTVDPYNSKFQRTTVAIGKLQVVYAGDDGSPDYGPLKHFSRDINGSSWTEHTILDNECLNIFPTFIPIYLAASVDTLHAVYHALVMGFNKIVHRKWDGSTWSGFIVQDLDYYTPVGFSLNSNSNDLYAVYGRVPIAGYVDFRQYDIAPLAPQNLGAGKIKVGPITNIILLWKANREPDIASYKIFRRMQTEQSPTHIATVSHPDTDYIDQSVQWGNLDTAYYHVTAVDVANSGQSNEALESAPSNIAWIQTNQTSEPALSDDLPNLTPPIPKSFGLMPNFPNPFNPSTLISYQVPRDVHVTLKVYDVLGQEVRSLVDEEKPAGYYEVTLDASGLASGTYFYRMVAGGEFVAVRKLVVMK